MQHYLYKKKTKLKTKNFYSSLSSVSFFESLSVPFFESPSFSLFESLSSSEDKELSSSEDEELGALELLSCGMFSASFELSDKFS